MPSNFVFTGGWRSLPASSARNMTPDTSEYLTDDADEWLMAQIAYAKDNSMGRNQVDADILISSPHFEPQDLKKTRQALLLRNNFDATSSHQLSPCDLDLANTRLVSRKVLLNTSYVGFRPQNVKGVELKEFISYDDWSTKSHLKNASDEIRKSRSYPSEATGTISIESFVDSLTMESTAVNSLDSHSCKRDGRKLQSIPHNMTILPQLNKTASQSGHVNIVPLAGRIILMAYRYKTVMEASSYYAFEKPALMLDIRSSVKYATIFKIIANFFVSKGFESANSNIVTSSSSRHTTGNESDSPKNHSNVELFYFHTTSTSWRAVKDEGVWSSAIMLCLENNQPLQVMVSRGKEVESRDIYDEHAPKGMSHARLDNFKDCVGASKKLLTLRSCINDLKGEFSGYSSDDKYVKMHSSLIPSSSICPLIIKEKVRYNQIEEISSKQNKIKDMIAALHHAGRIQGCRKRSELNSVSSATDSSALQVMAKAYPQPLAMVSSEIITFSNKSVQHTKLKKCIPLSLNQLSLVGEKNSIKKNAVLQEKQVLLAESLVDKLILSRW